MKINKPFDGNHLFFMSDIHYGHENMIKICHRPFLQLEDMNDWILEHIRNETTPDDIIVDLGDMFWKPDIEETRKIIRSIPAKIYKVRGNHDNKLEKLVDEFEEMEDILDLSVNLDGDMYQIVCCHYPMISWPHKTSGTLHAHGHVHGHLDGLNSTSVDLRVDVGMDGELSRSLGTPLISFKDLVEYLLKKTGGVPFKQWVDNHAE